MEKQRNILYVHGMGGGGDSRIPRLLQEQFEGSGVRIVVRTYDFDPERGRAQILGWVEELSPVLVIGESLGSLQAIRIRGIPHLLVSPSIGAAQFMYRLAWLTRLPGLPALLPRIWRVKEGDRQPLRFEYAVLARYRAHWEDVVAASREDGNYFAFFGRRDHYRKWGIVRISSWRKMFGDSFQIYEGTHFMEEEYVYSLLVPKIREMLTVANMDGFQ